MKKRISLLAVCVVFTMAALMACGEKEPIPTGNSTGVEEFVTGLSLASNQNYSVLNKDGEEITEQFLGEIKALAANKEWNKIDNYCRENTLLLVEKLPVTIQQGEQGERKTESRRCIAYVSSEKFPDGKDYTKKLIQNLEDGITKKVIYDLEGTITYDPNTGVILDAKAALANFVFEDGCTHNMSYSDVLIRPNKAEAEVVGEVVIAWGEAASHGFVGDKVIFMPAKHSFVITSGQQ